MAKPSSVPSRGGLSLLVMICAITCILLIFNSAFIVAFYEGLSQSFDQFQKYPKLKQSILFAAPLLLLIAEWKTYDLVSAIIQRRKNRTSTHRKST